jgi:ubiquinone/menaquinone biosynthesis C-methylase UbiE
MSKEVNDPIRDYWEMGPCGTGEFGWSTIQELSKKHRDRRYQFEPFIPAFAGFSEAKGKKVLEIGYGAGTDLLEFARNGAQVSGIDLTEAARTLAAQRAESEGLSIDLRVGGAEALPWPDETFDIVYSFGVIHHAAHPESVVAEACRVLNPGGVLKVMLYNRRSINGFLYWIRYGLLKGRLSAGLKEILAEHLESPGTRAYTVEELEQLLGKFERIFVQTVVTVYDMRIGPRIFLPLWTHRLVPSRWGWNHLVTAYKPDR